MAVHGLGSSPVSEGPGEPCLDLFLEEKEPEAGCGLRPPCCAAWQVLSDSQAFARAGGSPSGPLPPFPTSPCSPPAVVLPIFHESLQMPSGSGISTHCSFLWTLRVHRWYVTVYCTSPYILCQLHLFFSLTGLKVP